nr:MAG TPA: hypothetical protein [Caudoviricetes sp.]
MQSASENICDYEALLRFRFWLFVVRQSEGAHVSVVVGYEKFP